MNKTYGARCTTSSDGPYINRKETENAKSKSDVLDKKSLQLQKDRKVTETEIEVAKNLLTNVKNQ